MSSGMFNVKQNCVGNKEVFVMICQTESPKTSNYQLRHHHRHSCAFDQSRKQKINMYMVRGKCYSSKFMLHWLDLRPERGGGGGG